MVEQMSKVTLKPFTYGYGVALEQMGKTQWAAITYPRYPTLFRFGIIEFYWVLLTPLPTPGLRREAPERSSDPSEVAVGAP